MLSKNGKKMGGNTVQPEKLKRTPEMQEKLNQAKKKDRKDTGKNPERGLRRKYKKPKATKTTPGPGRGRKKWQDTFYVEAYKMACQGYTDGEIAIGLGVSSARIVVWKRDNPAFAEAIEQGKDQAKGNSPSVIQEYINYVYELMPQDMKTLYDEIRQFHEKKKHAKNHLEQIDALLRHEGKRARQYLFLQALVASNFNPSKACRFVAINLSTFEQWIAEEPEFRKLMEQMQVHKKNLFESALVKLVKQGDPSAVIFANKSLNRDRGYMDKSEVNVSGEIRHLHQHRIVDIEALNLPLEIRRKLLDAVREQLPDEVVPTMSRVPRLIEAKITKGMKDEQ